MSYYSEHAMFKELTEGISFYEFLEEITENYGQMKDTIISRLKDLMEMIFVKNKLMVSVTADSTGYKLFLKDFSAFIGGLKERSFRKTSFKL